MKSSLTVNITRNYGTGGSVSISMAAERMIDKDTGMVEFDELISRANLYFEHFDMAYLPHMRFTTQDTAKTETMPALEIRVTMEKGKRYWKVATPQYQEHGIPFWPEHMKESGIDPRQIPDDGHKCKEGTTAVVEMVNGKPKRVLKLVASK